MAVDHETINQNVDTAEVNINIPPVNSNAANFYGPSLQSNIIDKYDQRFIGVQFQKQNAVLLTMNHPGTLDDGVPQLFGTNQFLLTSLKENRNERVQILETFGSPSFYFFDERTKVYNIAGILLEAAPLNNSHLITVGENSDFSKMRQVSKEWVGGFQEFWDTQLRGSKLAEQKRIAVLVFGNDLMYGYPISFGMTKTSNTPNHRLFNMTMIVTDHQVKEKYKYYYSPYLSEDVLTLLQLKSVVGTDTIAILSDITKGTVLGENPILTALNGIDNAIITIIEEIEDKNKELLASGDGMEIEEYATILNDVEQLRENKQSLIDWKTYINNQLYVLSSDNAKLKIKIASQ
jgi:hypothetical protein